MKCRKPDYIVYQGNVAPFLAGDESRFVNGAVITCDGGRTCF